MGRNIMYILSLDVVNSHICQWRIFSFQTNLFILDVVCSWPFFVATQMLYEICEHKYLLRLSWDSSDCPFC